MFHGERKDTDVLGRSNGWIVPRLYVLKSSPFWSVLSNSGLGRWREVARALKTGLWTCLSFRAEREPTAEDKLLTGRGGVRGAAAGKSGEGGSGRRLCPRYDVVHSGSSRLLDVRPRDSSWRGAGSPGDRRHRLRAQLVPRVLFSSPGRRGYR